VAAADGDDVIGVDRVAPGGDDRSPIWVGAPSERPSTGAGKSSNSGRPRLRRSAAHCVSVRSRCGYSWKRGCAQAQRGLAGASWWLLIACVIAVCVVFIVIVSIWMARDLDDNRAIGWLILQIVLLASAVFAIGWTVRGAVQSFATRRNRRRRPQVQRFLNWLLRLLSLGRSGSAARLGAAGAGSPGGGATASSVAANVGALAIVTFGVFAGGVNAAWSGSGGGSPDIAIAALGDSGSGGTTTVPHAASPAPTTTFGSLTPASGDPIAESDAPTSSPPSVEQGITSSVPTVADVTTTTGAGSTPAVATTTTVATTPAPTTTVASTTTTSPPPPTTVPCIDGSGALDSDCDGVTDADERLYGSRPGDPRSRPEHRSWDAAKGTRTCLDSVDNDRDGRTDALDPGCGGSSR
jgi:hypothetical protein